MDKELCFIIEKRKLFLEQVLVDYNDIPIFFLCKSRKQYYIVLCTDIDELKYVVAKLSLLDVYNLLHENIPMRDVILKQKEYWDVVSNDDISLDKVTKKTMSDLDLSVLPKENLPFKVLTENMELFVRAFDEGFLAPEYFSKIDNKAEVDDDSVNSVSSDMYEELLAVDCKVNKSTIISKELNYSDIISTNVTEFTLLSCKKVEKVQVNNLYQATRAQMSDAIVAA